jgi:hypothetical protein
MTQFVPVGRTGTVLGEVAPVGGSVGPCGSGGFVLTMAFGGILDFSAEGTPAGVSNVSVWTGGETRSEEPSDNAALAGGSGASEGVGVAGAAPAGGSDLAASDGVFGVAGAALAGGSDRAASDGEFGVAGAALAGGSDLAASDGEFGVAGAALAGGSDLAASDGEFGVAGAALAGGSDLAASDGDFCLAGPALAGGSDRVASDGDFCLAGPALAGGSDRVASEGVFGGPAGVSDSTRSRHSSCAERVFCEQSSRSTGSSGSLEQIASAMRAA